MTVSACEEFSLGNRKPKEPLKHFIFKVSLHENDVYFMEEENICYPTPVVTKLSSSSPPGGTGPPAGPGSLATVMFPTGINRLTFLMFSPASS